LAVSNGNPFVLVKGFLLVGLELLFFLEMAKMALIVPLRKLSLFEFDFCFSCAEQSSARLRVLIRITTL